MADHHYHLEPQFNSVNEERITFKEGILKSKFSPDSSLKIQTWDLLILLDSMESGFLNSQQEQILFDAAENLKKFKDMFNLSIILRILSRYRDKISPALTEVCHEMLL